jgi:Fic family protein
LLKSSALFSSKIEGNTLDLNSFLNSKILNKKQKKEAQEIGDLIEAYKFAQKHKLNEKNLLEVHKILSKNILAKSRQGKYRKESVGVFSSQGLEYLALEAGKVENEMKEFFQEIEKLLKKKLTKKEAYFWSL